MTFIPEPVYFFPAHNEDKSLALSNERFKDAIIVTVLTMSRWYPRYEAELLMPIASAKNDRRREGTFSDDPRARAAEVQTLCAWIFDNSFGTDLFALFLRDKKNNAEDGIAPFDHHDDTCCWALDVSPEQFAELQSAWEAALLPKDLFYDAKLTIETVRTPGTFVRFLNRFGFNIENKRCYSPKEWELNKKNA